MTPLNGLDEIPWADLKHAYGPAVDVPTALRALARPGHDPERAERLDHLDASIYHQGGAVYSAGAAAVPFLVELAATPGLPLRAEIVELIGQFVALQTEMREPWRSNEHAVACRAALVAAQDTLIALVDDTDSEVRTAAAALLWDYALWSPRAHEAANAMVRRDTVEPDLALRVSLRLDGARAAAEAHRTGAPSAAPLTAAVRRLTAAPGRDAQELRLACLAASRRLDPASATWRDLLDAALAPATPHNAYQAWAGDGSRLARALCGMCGGDATTDHLNIIRALIGHEKAQVRTGALQAAGDAMLRWRSASPALLPLIGAMLLDPEPENRTMSADLLAAAGTTAAAFDDRLAAALEDPHRRVAIRAAWALARHGDARAVPTLVHALKHEDEDGFGSSAFYNGSLYWFCQPPLREALVACATRHGSRLAPALRSALARCWSQSGTSDSAPIEELNSDSLPRFHLLCDALAACGPAAAEAMPELEALLDSTHPQLAFTVIEATGPAATRLIPRLDAVERTALEAAAAQIPARYPQTVSSTTTGQAPSARLGQRVPGLADPWITALAAARTRIAVTGDKAALLHTVDEVLALTAVLRHDTASRSEDAIPASAESAAKGRDAATLASALARCLSPLGPTAGTNRISWPTQWLRTNEWRWRSHEAIPIAWAHWRVTGDPGLALRVLGHVLDHRPGTAYSKIELTALRRVAEMGPAARKLAPLLQACLDRNERITSDSGWRAIALDDEVQQLASTALATMNIQR